MAALTDYQSGAMAGIQAAYRMGMAYQQVRDGKLDIGSYNQMVTAYNLGIQKAFAGNQTTINYLTVGTYSAIPYPQYGSSKPVHSIDGSWNQTIPVIARTTDDMNQATIDKLNAQNGYSRDDTNGVRAVGNDAKARSQFDNYLGWV
jgi:hypothetical protein